MDVTYSEVIMANCDTCGRSESREVKFYETTKLMICIDCATENFLVSHPELKLPTLPFNTVIGYNTKDIHTHLSKTVIGQDKAKKTLAIALYNHLKRIISDVRLEKNNVLLIGSTGVGKTLLVKELAEFTETPFGVADATTLTATGWSGEDPETVLLDLYQNCDGDVKKVERGIVFIDEIDKLAKDSDARYESSSAQRGLLKILEGAKVNLVISGKGTAFEKKININTSNILFICAGAFNGLKDIVKARLDKRSIGFSGEVEDREISLVEEEATTDDLQTYGFMSEFLGRIHARVALEDLDIQQLRLILTKTSSSLVSQYIKLFDMDGIKLEFSSTGLEEIAKQAYELKTGARGLKTVLEKVLFDYQYDYEGKEIYITKEVVLDKLGIKYENRQSSDLQRETRSRQ